MSLGGLGQGRPALRFCSADLEMENQLSPGRGPEIGALHGFFYAGSPGVEVGAAAVLRRHFLSRSSLCCRLAFNRFATSGWVKPYFSIYFRSAVIICDWSRGFRCSVCEKPKSMGRLLLLWVIFVEDSMIVSPVIGSASFTEMLCGSVR